MPGGRGTAWRGRYLLVRGLLVRGRRSWTAKGAVLLVAGGFCAFVQGSTWTQSAPLAAMNLADSMVFVLIGLMLRREPGQRGVAWALMLGGIFRSIDFFGWDWSVAPVFGLVFGGVDRLFGAWAVLRYPNRALLRYQRAYMAGLTCWMLVGRTLIAVTSTARWNDALASSWWPTLIANPTLADVVNYVVNAGEGLLGVVLVVLLVLRVSQTRGLDRIVIAPIIVAGIAAVIAAIATAVGQMLGGVGSSPNGAYITESAVDLALPLAFLVAVIQRALLMRNITGLAAQFSADTGVGEVRHALRSTLQDPTLDVIDLSGPRDEAAAADSDAQQEDRLVEFIRTTEGTPIAVVIADPALGRYRGLFDAAVQTSGLALKNAQLQAQAAREKLAEVRASQARIIEAGIAERRRLERDLHDGVQQHLLGLAARLTAAMTKTTDPTAAEAFGQASDGLREVLSELRELAHGIHPAVLSHEGLAAALEDVAERLPLPVRVTAVGVTAVRVAGSVSRAAPAVEATAYFVACEALANVVKHAGATSATVTIRMADSRLDMEIADNGVGGVDVGGVDGVGGVGPGGRGLANISDRVGAVGGELSIDSPPGGGTRLVVMIPCG